MGLMSLGNGVVVDVACLCMHTSQNSVNSLSVDGEAKQKEKLCGERSPQMELPPC